MRTARLYKVSYNDEYSYYDKTFDEVSSFYYFKDIPDDLTARSKNRIKFVETLKAQTFLSLK